MKRGLANAMHKLPPCLAMTRYSRPCSVENGHKWETNYPMIYKPEGCRDSRCVWPPKSTRRNDSVSVSVPAL